MEEIWKDMNFSSLQGDGDHYHHHTTRELESIPPPPPPPKPNTSFCQHRNTFRARGTNLQEFLARPFDREPTSSCLGTSSMSSTDFCQFGPSAAPAAAAAPPLTSLCLNNSGPYQFHYFDNSGALHGAQPSHSITTTTATTNDVGSSSFDASMGSHPYDAFVSSAAFPAFCNKRGSESEENTVDRRCKRMIKNRESAARSRARRQENSYTHELENQVAVLTEQNEKLVEQRQQLYLALAVQVPKKRTLQRSSTAPF